MRGLSEKLKSALEVLAGFRGPKHLHAVRFGDLTPVNRKLNQVHDSTVRLTEDTQNVVDAVGNGSEPGTLIYDVNKALEDARQVGLQAAATHLLASGVSDDLEALTDGFVGKLTDAFDNIDLNFKDVDDAFDEVNKIIGSIETTITLRDVEQGQIALMADQANQNVLSALLRVSEVESGLRNAGFYVDPDTGRAGIEAIDAIDGRVNEVSVSVDAIKAEVALKASVAYVNGAISDALLDPTQIPVVTDLNVRLTDAEATVNALDAEVKLKASATEVSGHNARIGTAENKINALEGEITQKVSIADFTPVETRLTTAEHTLSAVEGAQSRQVLFDIRELHDATALEEVQTLDQLLEWYKTREAVRKDIAYAINDVRALVTDNRVAISTAKTELAAAIDGNAAQITKEAKTRASETGALAKDIATYKAEFDDFDAYARETFFASANLDGALASFGRDLVAELEAPEGAIGSITANLSEHYLTKVNTQKAITAAKTELVAELTAPDGAIGALNATLSQDYLTKVNTQKAITAAKTELVSELTAPDGAIGSLNATLSQDYLTKVNTQKAITAAKTELVAELTAPEGAIGSLNATLSQDYLTKVNTNNAITGAKEEMQAEVSKLRGELPGFSVALDSLEVLHLSPSAVLSNDPQFGQDNTIIVTQTGPAGHANGKTNGGAVIEIPEQVAQQHGARRVKISVLARMPANYPAASFSIAYSTRDNGNSGVLSNADAGGTGPDWEWFNFFYDVPAPTKSGPHYIGLYGDDSGTAKKTEFAKVVVQVAAEAEDLPQISQLDAELKEISGLDVNANTAFGSFLTELNVDSGTGKIAGIKNFGSAMADIHGNAEAAYVMRAKAGGAQGEMEIVAWDNAKGTGSAIVLTSDNIFAKGLLQADKLAVGVAQNMLSNSDLELGMLHYAEGGTGTIGANRVVSLNEPGTSYAGYDYRTINIQSNTGATTNGYARLHLAPEDKDGNRKLGYRVKKKTWYEWHAAVSATRADFKLLVRWYDAAGNIIDTEEMLEVKDAPASSVDNPEDWERYGDLIKSPDNAAFARPMIQLHAVTSGSSGIIRVYAPFFAKTVKDAKLSNYGSGNVTLVTGDGIATKSVTADHLDVISLDAVASTIGHFKSAEDGARIEIMDDAIKVFRGDGTLAVQLGNLDA